MEQKIGQQEKERAECRPNPMHKHNSIEQPRMQMDREMLMAELAGRKAGIKQRKFMVGLISALAKK